MEETRSCAQADFLDLRRTLAELAGGAFALLCAAVFTLYSAVRIAALILNRDALGLSGLVCGGLWLLAFLFAVVGLWILYFKGRGEKTSPLSFKLMRVLPIVESVLGVLACIVMLAVLVVLLFSSNTVNVSIAQLSETLQEDYSVYLSRVLSVLSNFGFKLLIAISIFVFLLLALLTLRYIMLAGLLKKLVRMCEKNEPMKCGAGFTAFLSYLFGLIFGLLGSSVCRHDLSAGLSLCLYGLALFSSGLLLHKSAFELNFLTTYYAKLNRAVKRRAEAIRAQKEALMNAPLAIAASADEEAKSEAVDDIPGGHDAPDVIVPPAPEEESAPDVIGVEPAEEADAAQENGEAVNKAETDENKPSQNEDISV